MTSIIVTETLTTVSVSEATSTVTITEGVIGTVTAVAAGPAGAQGAPGPAGEGVPTGGTTGQVLRKSSNGNYSTEWASPSAVVNGAILADLSDVVNSGLGSRDVLEYDSGVAAWVNSPIDKSPSYTYTAGKLTRVDYSNGNYKILSYTGTALTSVVHYRDNVTITKSFSYNLDGSLASITETDTY